MKSGKNRFHIAKANHHRSHVYWRVTI